MSLKVGAGAKVNKNDMLAVVNNAESSKPDDIVAPLDGEVEVFVRDGEQVKTGQGIVRIVQLEKVEDLPHRSPSVPSPEAGAGETRRVAPLPKTPDERPDSSIKE